MANPEHLEILKQGVEKWDQWRRDNLRVIPDLRDADLRDADLSGVRLFRTNLTGATIAGSDLTGAKLYSTNLNGAILRGAILTNADLRRAQLNEADLSKAILNGANLVRARLIRADLSKADLKEANLRRARLNEANLNNANLRGANLREAKCNNANLSMAGLRWARLMNTNLDGATLTGARLWETQRARWSIKSVICEYVYWDEEGVERNSYGPGEFERLFADKTKIRLFYKDGINPLEIATIPALIKHLEDSHPGSSLRLVSIKEDSGGVVAELAIEGADNKSPEQLQQLKTILEVEAQQRVQYQRQALAEREARLQLEGEVKQLSSVVDKMILRQSIIVNQGGVTMGNETYQNYGQIGAQGHNAHAHDMTFNQIVNSFDLPALAKELTELREEMAKRGDSSPQAVIAQGEAAKAEMAAKEGNTSKVVEYLKAGGQGLLDIARETSKELLVAAIKASMGMQ
jgi:hypothetical protein